MPGLTNYLSSELLDHVNGKGSYTPPTNVYTGLYANGSGPTDAGGGTELSGNGYARVSTSGTDWNAASNGLADNANAITFPTATGDWSSAGHVGRFDAATAGNLLDYGDLSAAKTVQNGDTAEFAAGELDVNYNSNNWIRIVFVKDNFQPIIENVLIIIKLKFLHGLYFPSLPSQSQKRKQILKFLKILAFLLFVS